MRSGRMLRFHGMSHGGLSRKPAEVVRRGCGRALRDPIARRAHVGAERRSAASSLWTSFRGVGGEGRMDKLSSCWFSTDYLSRHNIPIQYIQPSPSPPPRVSPSSRAIDAVATGLLSSASSEPR